MTRPKTATSPPLPRISTAPISSQSSQLTRVVVTDFNMSFGSMVVFLIKLALAAIPALIVLALISIVVSAIFGGILGGLLFF